MLLSLVDTFSVVDTQEEVLEEEEQAVEGEEAAEVVVAVVVAVGAAAAKNPSGLNLVLAEDSRETGVAHELAVKLDSRLQLSNFRRSESVSAQPHTVPSQLLLAS